MQINLVVPQCHNLATTIIVLVVIVTTIPPPHVALDNPTNPYLISATSIVGPTDDALIIVLSVSARHLDIKMMTPPWRIKWAEAHMGVNDGVGS